MKKHGFQKLTAAEALRRDTRNGFYLVDGPKSDKKLLNRLIDKGSTVWLVRRRGHPDSFAGRHVSIVVENASTLEELQTAVEQKLWGCC